MNKDEKPNTEIEVTPAMVEAGVRVLYASCSIENPLHDPDRMMVRELFLEMVRAERQ